MSENKEKKYTEEDLKQLTEKAKAKVESQKAEIERKNVEIKNLSGQLESYRLRESSIPTEEEIETFKKDKADIAARKLAVETQEKSFNAIKDSLVAAAMKLAEKKAELFAEAEKLAADLHDKRISETETEIQKMHDLANGECQKMREEASVYAEKVRKETDVSNEKIRKEAIEAAQNIRSDAQKEYDRIVSEAKEKAKEIAASAVVDTENLKKQIKDLEERNAELSGDKTVLYELNQSLTKDKTNLSKALKEQKAEFDKITADYEKTMANFETLRVQLESSGKNVETFSNEIAGMALREQELNQKKEELDKRENKLSFKEEYNKNKSDDLDQKEKDIDAEVEKRYPEILAYKAREIQNLKGELKRLRDSIFDNANIIAKFEDLKAQFGDKNPTEILLDYERVKGELALALEKVNNTPSYVLQKTAEDLKVQEEKLQERIDAVAERERQSTDLQSSFDHVMSEKDALAQKCTNLEKDKKIVEEQLARLRSTYENPAEREDRIKAINEPLFKEPLERSKSANVSEMDWLKGINEKIEKSGLHFPNRILKAFHTALKTSEMSPLTVLAGVSGTGKSELPRLYSRFGGINFLSMPVEPNWDCQEAMLGYYNSIDNCFEPTDMLRLLAQSQRNVDDQQGMNDVMTMILLDEMNLANVELYFADFLSKLETRRGLADNDRSFPRIGVKIGSKMADFPLKLGRNVLWTGTMNNDETTKTLSDKVLDRGIVINFPRPKTLIRSRKNSVLAEPSPLLLKSNWTSWVNNAVAFEDDVINVYKEKIEKINEQLGKAGRALGHRVWQSIENYMSLYPDVIANEGKSRELAMDRAFEDQLVQKVMPKLRGLATRGSQNEVLEAIKSIIPETLHEDFKNAAEQNYGQFIWTTSGYLLRDDDVVLDAKKDDLKPEAKGLKKDDGRA